MLLARRRGSRWAVLTRPCPSGQVLRLTRECTRWAAASGRHAEAATAQPTTRSGRYAQAGPQVLFFLSLSHSLPRQPSLSSCPLLFTPRRTTLRIITSIPCFGFPQSRALRPPPFSVRLSTPPCPHLLSLARARRFCSPSEPRRLPLFRLPAPSRPPLRTSFVLFWSGTAFPHVVTLDSGCLPLCHLQLSINFHRLPY